MVSLQDRARDSSQDLRVYEESADSMTSHLISSAADKTRTLKTVLVTFLEIVFLVIQWASVFVVPGICKGNSCQHSSFSIILYVSAGVWVVQFLMDRYYTQEHYQLRLNGYSSFSRETKNLRKLPLMLASFEIVALLVASQVIAEVCTTKCKSLPREVIIQIIVSLGCAVQGVILAIYFFKVVRFNGSNSSPDVFKDEMLANEVNTSDVGFRDENLLEQLLERQQDVIRYYKHHNAQLGRRLITTSDENRLLKSTRSSA